MFEEVMIQIGVQRFKKGCDGYTKQRGVGGANRQTDRQTDRQTGRQADRQAGR